MAATSIDPDGFERGGGLDPWGIMRLAVLSLLLLAGCAPASLPCHLEAQGKAGPVAPARLDAERVGLDEWQPAGQELAYELAYRACMERRGHG